MAAEKGKRIPADYYEWLLLQAEAARSADARAEYLRRADLERAERDELAREIEARRTLIARLIFGEPSRN